MGRDDYRIIVIGGGHAGAEAAWAAVLNALWDLDALAHRYEHFAAFADAQYGQVMRDAAERAGIDLAIFPERGGAIVNRIGTAVPRTYWQKYWIQLCLHIMGWLTPAERAEAVDRLRTRGVDYAD